MMPTTDTPLYRRHAHCRAAHWMGCAGAALCLAFAAAAHAAPGGHGDGMGTQGPADSMPNAMTMPSQTSACTPDAPADQALVGKSLGEAKSMLRGCPWRIGRQDGKAMPTTRDYRPDRRTLTIDNDKVTSVTRG